MSFLSNTFSSTNQCGHKYFEILIQFLQQDLASFEIFSRVLGSIPDIDSVEDGTQHRSKPMDSFPFGRNCA